MAAAALSDAVIPRPGEVTPRCPSFARMGELRSPGKLKHAPPMRRSRLEMAKLQVRAPLGCTRRSLPRKQALARQPLPAQRAPRRSSDWNALQSIGAPTVRKGVPERPRHFRHSLRRRWRHEQLMPLGITPQAGRGTSGSRRRCSRPLPVCRGLPRRQRWRCGTSISARETAFRGPTPRRRP